MATPCAHVCHSSAPAVTLTPTARLAHPLQKVGRLASPFGSHNKQSSTHHVTQRAQHAGRLYASRRKTLAPPRAGKIGKSFEESFDEGEDFVETTFDEVEGIKKEKKKKKKKKKVKEVGEVDKSEASVDKKIKVEEDKSEGSVDKKSVDKKTVDKKITVEEDKSEESADEEEPTVRKRWSKLQNSLHPTQTSLGWDWVLFKMKKLKDEEQAQAYLDRKPVPAVKRGDMYYVVDHHHTLAALEASGFDVKVTVVVILEVPEDLCPIDFFWEFLEKRGWSFVRNADYSHATPDTLPKTFNMQDYHNDIYRSMGGFARVHRVLKRPKNLEARLFFEFKWGYFFYTNSEDPIGLWNDKRLLRSWQRVKSLVEQVDMQEYVVGNMDKLDVKECIYLSENVIEPTYQLMMFYLRALCLEYEKLSDEDKPKAVPLMSELFGEDVVALPEGCVYKKSEFSYDAVDEEDDTDNVYDEYGDERDFSSWTLQDKDAFATSFML